MITSLSIKLVQQAHIVLNSIAILRVRYLHFHASDNEELFAIASALGHLRALSHKDVMENVNELTE